MWAVAKVTSTLRSAATGAATTIALSAVASSAVASSAGRPAGHGPTVVLEPGRAMAARASVVPGRGARLRAGR